MELVSLQDNNEKEPLFYLFKHKDIDGLQLPLKGSSRIKYISVSVSSNYIAHGTNAGGIHIFRKSSLRHSRFLNAKVFPQPDSSRIVDVGVTNVKFSSQEKYLAAALSSGHVAVWELNFDKREPSQLVKKTDEHKGSTVTSLCWNSSASKLFIGDNKGTVSGLEVGTVSIRRLQTIIKEGPPIVQLDFADEKLLISNTKRCVYYHQNKENFVQIGTKARDGQYGACFVCETNNQVLIYCARPGARLWEVDSTGQVLSTQQYKKLLATSSSPVYGHLSGTEKRLATRCDAHNFPKLLVLRDQYLLTWTRDSVIIVDPRLGNVILWNNQLDDIEDICCNRQDMFVFQSGGRLSRYSLIPPKQCAAKLFVMGHWLQCAKVLVSCKSQIIPVTARDHVPEYVVRRVKEMLNDNLEHQEIVNELTELEENLEHLPVDLANEENESAGVLSLDDSESRSIASDFMSNPDSERAISTPPPDSLMEDMDDTSKAYKKPKLAKLKNAFKDQINDLSFDQVLSAGVQAAANINTLTFGVGRNVKPFTPWEVKEPRPNTRSSSDNERPASVTPSDTLSPTSSSRNDSVGSLDEVESDLEERKAPVVFKEMKKKKIKIHTVDIVSPLQPKDLIKMEKSNAMPREDNEKSFDSSKTVDDKTSDNTTEDPESSHNFNSGMNTQESKERILSRSAAAKQEVVQKARKFLKKLTPEEKDVGTFDMAKGTGTKGSGSKGMSGNISSPLELKSLVIISRETRKKIRENQKLYDPKELKSILCEWIVYLEKANVAIELVYPKNKEKREYYVTEVGKILSPSIKVDLSKFLDQDDTRTVVELTTMCFKMKIFSSGNDLQLERELRSEELLKCDACRQAESRVVLNIDSLHNNKQPHSNEDLQNDFAKTEYLCTNFQLLDFQALKGSVIANCLNHQDLLKNLLRCLDDFTERDAVDDAIETGDTKMALQLMKDKAENYKKRLLRHVFRLYYLVPRDVAKLCAEIYPHLHPWEVALFCLSTSTNLYSNCSDFLIYVTHLIQNRAKKSEHRLDVFSEIVRSDDFIILVYHSALILDDLTDSDVRCQCGLPRPGSHRTSFQYEELMIDIIKYLKADDNSEGLRKLLKISYNHGYWQGCIQLLVMLGLRSEALELCLQLGDISLLNGIQIWGWLPGSVSEWKFGLEYLSTFQLSANSANDDRNKDSVRFLEDVDSEKSHGKEETMNTTQFPRRDDENKHKSEVNNENNEIQGMQDELKTVQVTLMPEESDFETDLKHGEYSEILEEELKLNEIEQNDDTKSETFRDHAFVKKDLNNFEQHTCIKSATVSAGRSSLNIDIKSYLFVMLQKLGAKETLRVLLDSQFEKNFIVQEFYYRCILCSQLENHQSPLFHRVLREINDHMWSPKSTTLLPEVFQMKELEILHGSKEELFSGKEPLTYLRSLEDAACNWGINLPLAGSCCSCPLPLCEKLPGHVQGVIIFPCGHLYHKECNPQNYCLACFHDKLQIPSSGTNSTVF